MTIIKSARGLSLLAAAAAVAIWLAAAFPNPAGVCARCEDIYVMPPVGE